MISYEYEELFRDSSVEKQLLIEFDGGSFDNDQIAGESMVLEESLCSEPELKFGCCETGSFEIRILQNVIPLKGKWITVSMRLEGTDNKTFLIGRYKVDSDKPTADRQYRDITAYDAMYDINNAEVSGWYNSLTFPMTMKEFRDSFFRCIGIEQEAIELINDQMTVERTIAPGELSGKDVAESICEANGCFGHINRGGRFAYVYLQQAEALYPVGDLYPAGDLYPRASSAVRISNSLYYNCRYEDYMSRNITKLQIRENEEDAGITVGQGENSYIIEDNFLLYGKNAADMEKIASNILEPVKLASYRPCEANAVGNPCIEVGDAVRLITRDAIVETYVLQRRLTGIQSLQDSYEAEGTEYHSLDRNSLDRGLRQLKGKTNVLIRDMEHMRSEILDLSEEGEKLWSQITQTAGELSVEISKVAASEAELSSKITATEREISLKVNKGDVSSQLSVEHDTITLSGNRLVIESDNFALSKQGEVNATGTFTSKDASQNLESTQGGAGLQILHGGSEIGRFASGQADGVKGIGLSTNRFMVFTNSSSIGYIYNHNGYISKYPQRHIFAGSSYFLGDIACGGTKNRAVRTQNYGTVGMNALETASPFFADVGSGAVDKTGRCFIILDAVFKETIEDRCGYYVIVTKTSRKECWCGEKTSEYFSVTGEAGATFDWMILAKQKGYANLRMEAMGVPDDAAIDNIDMTSIETGEDHLEELAAEYLYEYEKEIFEV